MDRSPYFSWPALKMLGMAWIIWCRRRSSGNRLGGVKMSFFFLTVGFMNHSWVKKCIWMYIYIYMNVYESKGDSPHNLTVGFVVIFIIVGVFFKQLAGHRRFQGIHGRKIRCKWHYRGLRGCAMYKSCDWPCWRPTYTQNHPTRMEW
jgi:hypothetical protein